MQEYARRRGLRRRSIFPFRSSRPGHFEFVAGPVTPVYARVGRKLIEVFWTWFWTRTGPPLKTGVLVSRGISEAIVAGAGQ